MPRAPSPDPPALSPAAGAVAPARSAWRNPWWFPPFLGAMPPLEPRLVRVLGLVAIGAAFENYDLSLINSAIKQISDDLGIALGESGFYLGAIRLGGLLTFAILPFADRIGRRRVFLASLVGMSVATLASGLTVTPLQFVAAQIVSRAFMLAALASAIVVVTEEFPAEHRGWAVGALSAVGGLGYGLGAALYAAIDLLPHGWRALYVFGVAPLLLLPFMRGALGETARFSAHRRAGGTPGEGGLRAWWRPVARLVHTHPRRALGLGLAAMLHAMGSIAVFQYTSLFAQSVHGWEPWRYSVMILLGGAIGIAGNVVGGRLGDRFGRRRAGPTALALFPLFAGLFYYGPGWSLWLAFGGFVFCSSAGEVVMRALAGELFDTSHRGTSAGGLILVQTLGWSLGLFLVGVSTQTLRDLGPAVTTVALTVALGGACLRLLPETGRRELEEISLET